MSVRVLRLLEYEFDRQEDADMEMERWTQPLSGARRIRHHRLDHFFDFTLRSAVLPQQTLDVEPISPEKLAWLRRKTGPRTTVVDGMGTDGVVVMDHTTKGNSLWATYLSLRRDQQITVASRHAAEHWRQPCINPWLHRLGDGTCLLCQAPANEEHYGECMYAQKDDEPEPMSTADFPVLSPPAPGDIVEAPVEGSEEYVRQLGDALEKNGNPGMRDGDTFSVDLTGAHEPVPLHDYVESERIKGTCSTCGYTRLAMVHTRNLPASDGLTPMLVSHDLRRDTLRNAPVTADGTQGMRRGVGPSITGWQSSDGKPPRAGF